MMLIFYEFIDELVVFIDKFNIDSEILKLNKYLASLKEYYSRMVEDSAL